MNFDNKIRFVGIIILLLGIGSALLYFYPTGWLFCKIIEEFYANISTELISVSITILLIDYLYGLKEKASLKRRLINELGSSDIGFSSRALKELKQNGWLKDGSLDGADLQYANLTNLDLSGANLQNVNLSYSKLKDACLKKANLSNVVFYKSDLTECNLEEANLSNSELQHSILYGAKCYKVICKNTDFLRSNLTAAELRQINFNKCKFEESILKLTEFNNSTFIECKFLRANFQSANFKGTKLERSDFENVQNWDSIIDIEKSEIIAPKNTPIGMMEHYDNLINQNNNNHDEQ